MLADLLGVGGDSAQPGTQPETAIPTRRTDKVTTSAVLNQFPFIRNPILCGASVAFGQIDLVEEL